MQVTITSTELCLSLSLSGTHYSSMESSIDGSEMQRVTAAHSSKNHALYGMKWFYA